MLSNVSVVPSGSSSSGSRPAVLYALERLRQRLASEKLQLGFLTAFAAIGCWPLGTGLAYLFMFLFGLGTQLASVPMPSWLEKVLEPLITGIGAGGTLMSLLAGLLLPVATIVWSILGYQRAARIAASDLVWSQMALMLIDENYGRLIEEARRERFQLSINPVEFGTSFLDRVNHYAHYYNSYLELGCGPREIKPPTVVERNCWQDGIPLCLGACLNPCFGAGLPLFVPMALRVLLVWPRVLGIKQAVWDYFSGRHDPALEGLASGQYKLSDYQPRP